MENKSKGMAIVSLILGILSFITCGCCCPLGIIAIILALIVLLKDKGGKVMAIISLILSAISILIITISTIKFMPLKDSMMDFSTNMDQYIEEYEEDGTYPEFVEELADMANLTGEAKENFMKQFMDSAKESYENTAPKN